MLDSSHDEEESRLTVLDRIQKIVATCALVVAIAVGGVVLAQLLGEDDDGRLSLPAPDVPPLEYVYLDSARVLAYLGQVEQGLASTETRTLTEKRAHSGGIKGEGIVEVSANVERQRESQQVVTQTEADRFFTFLRILRRESEETRPLSEIDLRVTGDGAFTDLVGQVKELHEGDFIRISNARLSLPPFAAVYPRVRYVPYYTGGELRAPKRPLFAPVSEQERRDVVVYRRRLGENPRLPFIVPAITPAEDAKAQSATAKPRDTLSVIVPVQYSRLTTESGLLAGNVTIVGKVVYKDPRLARKVPKNDPEKPTYTDRQAMASFGQALQRAPDSLLRDLNMPRDGVADRLSRALTLRAPVLLVVPLAIYQ